MNRAFYDEANRDYEQHEIDKFGAQSIILTVSIMMRVRHIVHNYI